MMLGSKGYYYEYSKGNYAKSFDTLDFTIYDSKGEVVASIRNSKYTYLNHA